VPGALLLAAVERRSQVASRFFFVGLAESVDCSCLFESWAAVSSLDLLLVLIIQNHLLFIDIGLWFVIMTTNKSNKD